MTERQRPFDRATYAHLPMDGRGLRLFDLTRADLVFDNHTEAYRAYRMLRADLDASFVGGPRVDEDATLDAMAELLGMMLPAERRSLDEDGPLVLPDVEAA